MIQCDLAGFSFRRLGALSSLVVLSLFSRFRVALLSLVLPFYGAFMALLPSFLPRPFHFADGASPVRILTLRYPDLALPDWSLSC